MRTAPCLRLAAGAVLLSVLFVPVFFVVVRRWFKGSARPRSTPAPALDAAAQEGP